MHAYICNRSTLDLVSSAARHKAKEMRAEAMMAEKNSMNLYWFRLFICKSADISD